MENPVINITKEQMILLLKNPILKSELRDLIKRSELLEIKNEKMPGDILVCKVCKQNYTRSNRSNHNKSRIHRYAQTVFNNWNDLLFSD